MGIKNILLYAAVIGIFIGCSNNSEEDPRPEDSFRVNAFTAFIDENPANGTSIGTIDATSTSGTLSFQLVSQSPSGSIAVDAVTGEITVANSDLFVFATNPRITATVEVSNGTQTENASVTIIINDPGGPTRTIWTGAKTRFTKNDGADPTNAANQDRLTDNVWITRGNDGGPIYNANTESSSSNGPAGTEWAVGNIDQIEVLSFNNLKTALGGGRGVFKDLPGKTLVLHLIDDDIYLEVTFTRWSQGRNGGFEYERSTP